MLQLSKGDMPFVLLIVFLLVSFLHQEIGPYISCHSLCPSLENDTLLCFAMPFATRAL